MGKEMEITQYLRSLTTEISALQAEIEKHPSGHLNIMRSRNSFKWYVRQGEKLSYLSKKKHHTAILLARKLWCQARLNELVPELKASKAFLRALHQNVNRSEKKMLKCLEHPEIRRLLQFWQDEAIHKQPWTAGKSVESSDNCLRISRGIPSCSPLSESCLSSANDPTFTAFWPNAADWARTEYPKNPNHPEHLRYHTPSGILVRSKSEVLIAMTLEKFQVPFRYEWELSFEDRSLYPDFTILQPTTGRLFLWEHFGMMDDPEYVRSSMHKLPTYIACGFFPSDNLLMTFESNDRPIDPQVIEEIVVRNFVNR